MRKHALKSALPAMAALALMTVGTCARADLVVLQYHHISNTTPTATSTTPSLFLAQLDKIEELGLEVVPLDTGTRNALEGKLDERKQVAITFDDAYGSVWSEAAPALSKKDYPFTVFVNTGSVGGKDYMTWNQLAQLAERPGVLIANHSKDHGHLAQKPGESDDSWQQRITASLDGAQETLEKRLGTQVPMLAYPYGEFDDPLENAVAERDWLGFGQQSGPIGRTSSATRLPRFPMATAFGQLSSLPDKLLSKALPVSADQLPGGIMTSNPPELALELPEALAPERLSCFASGKGRLAIRNPEGQQVRIQADSRFDSRRFRYNCTYPAGDGRYYWLSHQWLDLNQPED